jgi:sulfotransferase family protein
MSAPRPNVFLIGSMKSGTTYLSELLTRHPAIFMSLPREPCHFADPRVLRKVWPLMYRLGYWRSTERYLELFANAGEAKIIAEGSTVYSQAPRFTHVPERILEACPDAKFIYIIRDPVERTLSHYWHRVVWWGERRRIEQAIRDDPHFIDTSHYAHQLEIYLRHVPRERIHVLTLEELVAEPGTHLMRLFGWLGVDTKLQLPVDDAFCNPTPATVEQARGFGMLDRFRKSPVYARIEPLVPAPLRKRAVKLAVREVRTAEVPTEAVKAYLRPIQRRQTTELSELLGREFPLWTTLFPELVVSGRATAGIGNPGKACLVDPSCDLIF